MIMISRRYTGRRHELAASSGKRREQGVAAVEFAIVLLPLLIIAFGAAEYGRAIYQYNTLVKSVRSAVRLVSATSPLSPGYSTVVSEAKCLAVYGNSSCTGNALAPGLAISNVKVCDKASWSDCPDTTQSSYGAVPVAVGTIDLVAVRISGYTYQYLGLPIVTPSASVNFSTIEAVMRQSS